MTHALRGTCLGQVKPYRLLSAIVTEQTRTIATDKLHSFELLTGMKNKAILSDLHGIKITGSLPSRARQISEQSQLRWLEKNRSTTFRCPVGLYVYCPWGDRHWLLSRSSEEGFQLFEYLFLTAFMLNGREPQTWVIVCSFGLESCKVVERLSV